MKNRKLIIETEISATAWKEFLADLRYPGQVQTVLVDVLNLERPDGFLGLKVRSFVVK